MVNHPILAVFLPLAILVVSTSLLLFVGVKRSVSPMVIAIAILVLGFLAALLNALLLRL